jgi:hypothetical protein
MSPEERDALQAALMDKLARRRRVELDGKVSRQPPAPRRGRLSAAFCARFLVSRIMAGTEPAAAPLCSLPPLYAHPHALALHEFRMHA